MHKFTYRPDIDGLRAFAILSVIIFHLNKHWLPNGFLGVDIFFVISGFLISSIIYQKFIDNSFSFRYFYLRRIKRIFPVFFVVLISILLICWYIFMDSDFDRILHSAFFSIVFATNLHFAKGLDYFDASSEENPILHFWSLAIEEQFYLFFPLVLFGLVKWKFLHKNILKIFSITILLIFISSFFELSKIGILANLYYLPHLRFMEILIGSLVAIFLAKTPHISLGRKAPYFSLFSLLGLLILLYPPPPPPPNHLGIIFLLVALLSGLLILGNKELHFFSRLFANKIFIWIGKLSFSLYLWHWVVLAIFRYISLKNELPWNWNLLAIIITIIFSILTYYLIELPIRKNNFSLLRNIIYFYFLPVILIFSLYFLNKQLKSPTTVVAKTGIDFYKNYPCYQKNQLCKIGDTSQVSQILIIGDSHTLHLLPFFDRVGKREHWSASVSPANGCPFLFNYIFQDKVNPKNTEYCKERNSFFEQKYRDFPIIILSSYWGHLRYNEESNLQNKLDLTLKKLIAAGKKIYVINSSFLFSGFSLNSLSGRIFHLARKGLSFADLNPEFISQKSLNYIKIIQAIVRKYSGVQWIDLGEIIIRNKWHLEPYFYLDNNHLSPYASAKIADSFPGFNLNF